MKKRGLKIAGSVCPQSVNGREVNGDIPFPSVIVKKRLLDYLEQSEWWSAKEIARYQFEQVRRVFDHAFNTVPFYKKRFSAVGLTPEIISPENWHDVPILKRDDLQTQQIVSNDIPQKHGATDVIKTSGATGQPVEVVGTQHVNAVWEAITVRDHLWHKRDLKGKLAVIRFSPSVPDEGLFSDNWGAVTAHLFRTGPSMMLSVKTDIDRQLDWLDQHNPKYLLTYPSNLKALLERSAELGKKPAQLKEVRTISEIITPELRTACRTIWGVDLTDSYTSQEVGYIALQCPEQNHYHIQSENVFVEVLNEQGSPCAAGETGRIVITSLHNYATPLIRYEIRDYAEVGEPCSCGRGLPVIKRILGRQRNMLVLPSGGRRWPDTGSMKYNKVIKFKQFQMIQHSLEEIELKLVVADPVSEKQEAELVKIIQKSLGHPFNISFTYHDEIPRAASGKFEDFKSNIA